MVTIFFLTAEDFCQIILCSLFYIMSEKILKLIFNNRRQKFD